MNIRGIAVCMLGAAAAAPWIPAAWWLLWLVPAGLLMARRFGPLWLAAPLCLLWCVGRMVPGPLDLRRHPPADARTAELEWVVAGDARRLTTYRETEELAVPVRVKAVTLGGEPQPASGRVQLRLSDPGGIRVLPGTRWIARGILEPADLGHVGLRRADWKFTTRAENAAAVPRSGLPSPAAGFFRIRDWSSRRLEAVNTGHPEVADVLQALLLGQRVELDEKASNRFARTGLIHVFAISGLHLGLLSLMCVAACRWLGISHRSQALVILPLLFLFTLCTGMRASALRALIMVACLLSAPLLYRRSDTLNALALAAVLILAAAPEQVFDLGFQYSFLMVWGLLVFGGWLGERTGDWFAPDPWAPESPRRNWLDRNVWRRIRGAVIVSCVCLALSAPLTARVFNLFSPVALVGNLLAVPLVFLLLFTGFLALPWLWLPVSAASVVFLPARLAGEALLGWVRLLERIPGGVQWVRSPPFWQLLAFYALLFAAWRRPERRRMWWAAGLVLAGYVCTDLWLDHRRTELVAVDADRGQAFWVRKPGGGVILIDTGSDWSGWELARHLKTHGVDRIDLLILTHPDPRHVEGLSHLLETHPPRRIRVSASDADHPVFADLPVSPDLLRAGDRLRSEGWWIEALWPPEELPHRGSDDRSLVLRFSDGFRSFLVMGGAGEKVETALLNFPGSLRSRLLLAGHPRSEAGCLPAFLSAARPEAVVFSGRGFEGVTPGRLTGEARVQASGLPVLRVPGGGELRFDLDRGTLIEEP